MGLHPLEAIMAALDKKLITLLENEDRDPDFCRDPELQAHASTEASFRVHTGKTITRKADAPKHRSVELANQLRAQQAVKAAIASHSKHRVFNSRRTDIRTHARNHGRGPNSVGL